MTEASDLGIRAQILLAIRGIGWGLVAATIPLSIRYIDGPLATFFRGIPDTGIGRMAAAITEGYSATFIIIVAVVVFLKFRSERDGVVTSNRALQVALAGSLALFLSAMLGIVFARADPGHAPFGAAQDFAFLEVERTRQSFPSSIAATAIALASSYASALPGQRGAAWAAGLLTVAASVASTHSYLSDAIAGAVLGSLCADIVIASLRFLDFRTGTERSGRKRRPGRKRPD